MRLIFLLTAMLVLTANTVLAQHKQQSTEPYECTAIVHGPRESDALDFSLVESRVEVPLSHAFLFRFTTDYLLVNDEHNVFDVAGLLGYRIPIVHGEWIAEIYGGPSYQEGIPKEAPDYAPPEDGIRRRTLAGRAKIRLLYRERYWADMQVTTHGLHDRLHLEIGAKIGQNKTWRPYAAFDTLYNWAVGGKLHLSVRRLVIEPGVAVTMPGSSAGLLASLSACLSL